MCMFAFVKVSVCMKEMYMKIISLTDKCTHLLTVHLPINTIPTSRSHRSLDKKNIEKYLLH